MFFWNHLGERSDEIVLKKVLKDRVETDLHICYVFFFTMSFKNSFRNFLKCYLRIKYAFSTHQKEGYVRLNG